MGTLRETCLLVGRGDPDISNRKFPYSGRVEREGPAEQPLAEMADRAVAKGLREVDGDIVADDSYFPYDPYPAGWTRGRSLFQFWRAHLGDRFQRQHRYGRGQPGPRMGEPATILTQPRSRHRYHELRNFDGTSRQRIRICGGPAAGA